MHKTEIQLNDDLIARFASMLSSDIQKYVDEHNVEFEEWQKEQDLLDQ